MSADTNLLPILRDEILACGPMTFHRFMELCLYHPAHGYYNSPRQKLGAQGDFYTSAHLVPIFSRLLARHFYNLWIKHGSPVQFNFIELGSGDGLLAENLLFWTSQNFPNFFACLSYTAVEQSPVLAERLSARLQPFANRVSVVANPPEQTSKFPGCVFSNEFFDALPVHLLVWQNQQWQERFVTLHNNTLTWTAGTPSSPQLAQEAETIFGTASREEDLIAEIRNLAPVWMEKLCQFLRCGELLIVDYGYTNDELRRGRFQSGSALGYRQHEAVYDLLANPGEQDLTAHVNFTELSTIAESFAYSSPKLISQSQFTLEIGKENAFADLFADCASEAERIRRAQLLKTLVMPQGMGEVFRVLRMTKDCAGDSA